MNDNFFSFRRVNPFKQRGASLELLNSNNARQVRHSASESVLQHRHSLVSLPPQIPISPSSPVFRSFSPAGPANNPQFSPSEGRSSPHLPQLTLQPSASPIISQAATSAAASTSLHSLPSGSYSYVKLPNSKPEVRTSSPALRYLLSRRQLWQDDSSSNTIPNLPADEEAVAGPDLARRGRGHQDDPTADSSETVIVKSLPSLNSGVFRLTRDPRLNQQQILAAAPAPQVQPQLQEIQRPIRRFTPTPEPQAEIFRESVQEEPRAAALIAPVQNIVQDPFPAVPSASFSTSFRNPVFRTVPSIFQTDQTAASSITERPTPAITFFDSTPAAIQRARQRFVPQLSQTTVQEKPETTSFSSAARGVTTSTTQESIALETAGSTTPFTPGNVLDPTKSREEIATTPFTDTQGRERVALRRVVLRKEQEPVQKEIVATQETRGSQISISDSNANLRQINSEVTNKPSSARQVLPVSSLSPARQPLPIASPARQILPSNNPSPTRQPLSAFQSNFRQSSEEDDSPITFTTLEASSETATPPRITTRRPQDSVVKVLESTTPPTFVQHAVLG